MAVEFNEYPKCVYNEKNEMRTVISKGDELNAAKSGFRPRGKSDPAAFASAHILRKEDYVYDEYPRWMYNAEDEPQLVRTADEERALGPDWHRTPQAAHVAHRPFAAGIVHPAEGDD